MKLFVFLVALSLSGATDPKAEIAAVRAQWTQSLHDKQIDQAVSLYTEDAIFFLPQGGHSDGASAIRTLFQTVTQTFDSDLHFHSKVTEIAGDLAADAGDFDESLVLRSTGAKTESKGSYLMVLRRDRNGKWKIAEQMWTGLPPETH